MSTILNRNDDPNIATRKDAGQHQNAAAAPKEHSENDVDKTPTNTKGRRNKRTQESADVKDKRKNELGNIKDKRTKKLAHNKSNPPQKQKQNNKGKADNLNKRNKRGDGSVKDKVSSTTVRRQSPSSETVTLVRSFSLGSLSSIDSEGNVFFNNSYKLITIKLNLVNREIIPKYLKRFFFITCKVKQKFTPQSLFRALAPDLSKFLCLTKQGN